MCTRYLYVNYPVNTDSQTAKKNRTILTDKVKTLIANFKGSKENQSLGFV